MADVAGIDGCKGGWLALTLGAAGDVLHVAGAPRWRDLDLGNCAILAVDMPVGLCDSGPRACDIAARRHLPKGRKSSVFSPPRRAMLACRTWAEANALGRKIDGTGISHQAWNLSPKIRELDTAIDPALQERIREVHPELVFQRLHGLTGPGSSPLPSKKTPAGRAARLALLEAAGIAGLPERLAALPRKLAQPDDLLDAAACALAARAIVEGTAKRLPDGPLEDPPRDVRGLRMEIWF
jgi:predicted RNase H-like nuclease